MSLRNVITILGNSPNLHILVQADIVLVAGESVRANRNRLRKINLLQAAVVIECSVTDHGVFTQGNLLQIGCKGERALADHCIVTNSQGAELGVEIVIEILLAVFRVALNRKAFIFIDGEGVIANSNVITDDNRLQLHTFTEHALSKGHTVRNVNTGQAGVRKGILAHGHIRSHVRQLGNSRFEEAIGIDTGQHAQLDSFQRGGRTEAVLPYHSNIGQGNRGNLRVVRECALTNDRNCGTVNVVGSKFTASNRCNSNQGIAVSGQNIVVGLDLKGLIAGLHLKGADLGGTEREGADIVDVGTNGNLLQIVALIEHTLRQDRSVDIEIIQSLTAGERVCTILDLIRSDGHVLQALTAGKGILANGQQAIVGNNTLQILVAGKGIVGDDAGAGQVDGTLQVAVFECVLVDDEQVVLTTEGNLLQLATTIERTVLNGFQSRGQHDLFKSRQISERIRIDLGNTLRDNNLGNGVFTDVPLLADGIAVDLQFFFCLGDIVKVGERKGANFLQGKVCRNADQTAVTIVVVQDTGIGNEGILNLNGNCFGIVSRFSIHQNTDRYGGEAFLLGSDNTGITDFNNVFVAGFEGNRRAVGEIGIQIVGQRNGFGGIHGQRILAVKETDIAGIAQHLFVTVNHVICLFGHITGQLKHVCNGFVIAAVALIPFLQNRDLKGHALVGGRIADLNRSHTGTGSNQLIVHNANNAELGRTKLQQLGPFGVGINQGLQRENFIGAQGQALFQTVKIEVQIVIRQADFIGGHVQRIVINSQNEGVLIQRFFLNGVNVIRQLISHVSGAIALRIHRGHVLAEDLHGRTTVAISVYVGGNVTHLRRHGKVVIIDTDLSIQTVLLQGLVILIVVLNIGNRGGLKVNNEGELKYVTLVGFQTAIAVVHVTNQLDRILGVVGKVIVHGVELDFDVSRINGAAVTVGLTDIIVNGFKDHFAGGIVCDSDNDLGRVTQQTGPDKTQRMDRAILIGKRNIISVGRNDHVVGILDEVVRAQIADIILRHAADGTGGVGISHGLVFGVNAVVQLVSVGFVVIKVHQRSNSPVTEECQIRNAHIHVGAGGSGQGDEALDIHTIFKGAVQIGLVSIGQCDLHGNLCILAALNGNILTVLGTAGNGNDLKSTAQSVSFLGNRRFTGIGLILTDTFGQNVSSNVIGQSSAAEVVNGEGHFINAGLLRIITQLQLGLIHGVSILVISGNVSLGIQAAGQISQTCTLLTNRVRQTVGVQGDVCGRHHQLVDHLIDLDIVICNVGEILHNILPQQDDHAGQVGTSHRGTGQTVITTTGNRGENIAAVSSDLRLNIQAGSGAPGGEIGNERAGGLIHAQGQLTAAGSSQQLTVILRNGTNSQLSIADIHLDITGNVVVNDDTGSTLSLSDHSLFLKGVGTTADQSDLALHIHAGIVSATANAGNDHELDLRGLLITQQRFNKIKFLSSGVVGLIEVHNGIAVLQIGSLLAVDGSDGHNTLIGAGRTNRTRIGVGGQGQVTVLLRTKSGRIAVGRSNDNRNTCFTQLVVNAVHDLLVRLTSETASSTEGHVDHVNTQNHAVLQSGQDPAADSGVINVGEDLHRHQLCIGSNTGDGIVFTDNNTGNVGAVVIVGGVNVRIVIGIVIAERNLLIDVNIINSQAAIHFIRSGLTNQRCHVLISQA